MELARVSSSLIHFRQPSLELNQIMELIFFFSFSFFQICDVAKVAKTHKPTSPNFGAIRKYKGKNFRHTYIHLAT
jgi:hypothetical protein